MIDKAQFLATLTDIFRSELDDDSIVIILATTQKDLATWDSLAHVRIVMGVENAYDVQFEVEEIETIDSVQGFYDVVSRHKG